MMVGNRVGLVGLILLALGVGIYFVNVLAGGRDFAGEFLASLRLDKVGGEKSAEDTGQTSDKDNAIVFPAKNCSFATSQTPSRDSVIFNEVAWMGTPENGKNEWVELKNISSGTIDVGGWRLLNQNGKVKIDFGRAATIPPGGFFLLGTEKNIGAGAEADLTYKGALRNSGDNLRLFDADCRLLDEIAAASSWPAGDNVSKKTMERDSKTLAWRTSAVSGGTPKKENTPAPAPSANILTKAAIPPAVFQQSTSSANIDSVSNVAANQTLTNQPPETDTPPPPPPTYYALQVSKSGNGGGSLTSNPSGISCPNSCSGDSENFISGVSVALTALAADGSEFAGWSGDCSGNAACSLAMNGNKSAIAVFNQIVSSPPPPPATISLSPRSNTNHILLSQIQITGGAGQTTNDFIEIYNPTALQFNLKGHRLVKRTQTGSSDTLIKSWTGDALIPAYGFYLWANSGYAAISVIPDATTTASLADDNGVAIRFGPNDTGTMVDSAAWGKAQNVFVESAAFSANPGANQSILRKSWQGACVAASFDLSVGNGCDTDNNASDFELKSSEPRNSRSQ